MSSDRSERKWMVLVLLLVTTLVGLLRLRDSHLFYHDDNQMEYLPVFAHCARTWLSGQVPLMTDLSWFGGNLAGEYQYGIFSLTHQLVVILTGLTGSLSRQALCIGYLYLLLGTAGSYRLGRAYGLSPILACSAGLAGFCNGYVLQVMARAWLPGVVSFAWVPWVWLVLQGPEPNRKGLSPFWLAFFVYSGLSGGWPYSDLWIGMLCVSYAALALAARDTARLRSIILGFLWGVALAAPSLLLLIQTSWESNRVFGIDWTNRASILDLIYTLLPDAPLPPHPPWDFLEAPKYQMSVGVVPAIGLLALPWMRSSKRAALGLGSLFLLTMALAILPSSGGFRWSYRWFPMVLLSLSLLGHLALHQMADPQSPKKIWNPGVLAALLACLGLVFSLRQHASQAATLNLAMLIVAVVWGVAWRSGQLVRRNLGTAALCVLLLIARTAIDTTAPALEQMHPTFPDPILPSPVADLVSGGRTLSLFTHGDWNRRDSKSFRLLLAGNDSLLYGAECINGYSPLYLKMLNIDLAMDYNGGIPAEFVVQGGGFARLVARWGFLNTWGIDFLILGPDFGFTTPSFLTAGWKVRLMKDGVTVLGRPSQKKTNIFTVLHAQTVPCLEASLNRILQKPDDSGWVVEEEPKYQWSDSADEPKEFANVTLSDYSSGPQGASVHIDFGPEEKGPPALVAFNRPWRRGYRASYGGRSCRVCRLNGGLLAVEVTRENLDGDLKITYFPQSLVIGLLFAASALATMGLFAWLNPGGSAGRKRQ